MGMSSSQARLLSLTARQHDVEWRAQKLQADKLQLANDSDRVYNTYLTALNAKKIQTRVYDQWEGDTFKDATLAMLENGSIPVGRPGYQEGEYAATPLFLQEISTGRLMITPEYATSIGVTSTDTSYNGTLEDFLTNVKGYTKDKVTIVEEPTGNTTVTDKVIAFDAVGNSGFTQYSHSYSYSPVDNSEGGIDYEALKGYAEFNNAHTASTTGTAVSDVSSFTSGSTYTINNVSDLKKLLDLSSSQSTNGVNFVLTSDIDLSGINWTGIQNFQGTFDGNGYKVTNLTGTQGLFASTDGATIKNVGLENVNVNGNSSAVGGLIGNAINTNIDNAYTSGSVTNSYTISQDGKSSSNGGTGGLVGNMNYTSSGPSGDDGAYTINNVFSSADVTGTDNVGGLLGGFTSRNSDPNFSNAYAIGDVKGNNNVGGFAGHMYNDQDSPGKETDIKNVYSGGNVTGNSAVGGFFGNYLYWGDGDDYCKITGCSSSGKVNGNDSATEGAFAGQIYVKLDSGAGWNSEAQKYVNFIDCGFASNTGAANGYGVIKDTSDNDVTNLVVSSGSGGGLVEFQVAANIPSINSDGSGGYYSNVYSALIKAGMFDPAEMSEAELTVVENQIKNFIRAFADNDVENEKLYYLNEKLYSYLNGGNDSAFAAALVADVTNGTKTSTSAYQTGPALSGKVKRSTADDAWEPTFNEAKGTVTIPSVATMKQNLKSASNMAGLPLSDVQIEAFFNKYDTTKQQDLAYLAGLNEKLYDYSKGNINSIGSILTTIVSGNKYTEMPSYIDDLNHYTISMETSDKSSAIKNSEQYKVDIETAPVEYRDWDWEDPKIQAAVAEYNMLKGGFIIIGDGDVTEDYDGVGMDRSTEWLSNVIQSGIAQFVTYNHETGEVLGTSVANETSLQEVQNTTYLNAAEATYEKDMKKINQKETKIDTSLQKLEAERTSIKTEQDDLKKVINDNVDLTFKLFS